MAGGKNVRIESGMTFNIGSLNLKKALFLKAQHYIGESSYEEMNQYTKEILRTGIYIKKNLQNGNIIHRFQGKDLVLELDSKAKQITNIHPTKEKKASVQKPPRNQQKDNLVKLVEQTEIPQEKIFTSKGSFLENTLQAIYDKLLEVEEYSRELSQSLSKADKDISEIYHKLEAANFNASQGYFFAKKLQTLLRKRRWIKTELNKIRSTDVDMKQIKERIQQAEKKMSIQQKQYETYTKSWDFLGINEFSE